MAARGSSPAGTSKGPGPVRVDDKPTRQSFSCAECKRLKLKCSRSWPCTSCEKRGCAQICPNGQMKSTTGKRLILANTEELHQRISLLEVGLAKAHAKVSSDPHPLLSQTYLFTTPQVTTGRMKPDPDTDDVTDGAFGTLTISAEGEAHFIGSFAGSQYLRDEDESASGPSTPSDFHSIVNAEVPGTADGTEQPPRTRRPAYADSAIALHDSFITGGAVGYDVESLRDQLPDWDEEGRDLMDSYWDHVNWMYEIIPKASFSNDHWFHAYERSHKAHPHKLACVFLMMAVGSMMDLRAQPWHPRSERLFLLGRACLSLVGLEHASPATVQALHLMGTYILNDRLGNGAEVFWPILGTALKVTQSLGLHRDGTHFGLSPYEVDERRQVFWEIVTYDRLQSMCFGRPTAIANRTSDTKFPEEGANFKDEDGFHRSKYRLIMLMEKVIDIQTQTTPVSYSSVCKLDAELVEFRKSLPESLLPSVSIVDLPLDRMLPSHLVLHRLGIRLMVAQTRLLLNRPFFARALKDRPDNPARSKYGESFVALYEGAEDVVNIVKQLVIYHPSLIARWWFFWFHAFSAAVCLSAIAIRAPTSAFATPAFTTMSLLCDICAAARDGCRAKNGLPLLLRLRERAAEAFNAAAAANGSVKKEPVAESDNDLGHLNQTAKLVRTGSLSSPKRVGSTHSQSPGPQSPPANGTNAVQFDWGPDQQMPNLHTLASNAQINPIGMSIDAAEYGTHNWLTELEWQGNMLSEDQQRAYLHSMDNPLNVDTDMTMALGLGLGAAAESDEFGFDIETFVNQMGERGFGAPP
ncbi:hypothetical protein Q8F55_001218 [Vanrija albida]|uniref:Zn(2)-C6 fungal-type domain-containing protein n=1 Tax=Vanrija albida TaxID=181172 RepID=A0ABR3QFG7_9TREE